MTILRRRAAVGQASEVCDDGLVNRLDHDFVLSGGRSDDELAPRYMTVGSINSTHFVSIRRNSMDKSSEALVAASFTSLHL